MTSKISSLFSLNQRTVEMYLHLIYDFSKCLSRCGCLQVGDRILAVNYQPNLTLQEINSMLELGNEQNGKITLQVEFDVADSVVPTSGIFTVKLAKRGPGLGITITGKNVLLLHYVYRCFQFVLNCTKTYDTTFLTSTVLIAALNLYRVIVEIVGYLEASHRDLF